jgi:CBS domain-containing protein
MRDLKARSLMTTPVVSSRRTTPARDVALQLLSGHYTGMPVTDNEGKVIGIVSEFDLLAAVNKGKDLAKTTAEEVMTSGAVTADLDTPASSLIKLMEENNIIRLPITDNGKLVGVVARCDILKTVIDPILYVL